MIFDIERKMEDIKRKMEDIKDKQVRQVKKVIKWSSLSIVFLILIFGTFYTIGAGERGVLLTFGKPSETAQGEGFHIKFPLIQKVIKIDVKTQKYEADASAASKDLQIVTSKIATNYHLIPESVPTLYREIGIDYSARLIQPLEQEVVKSITAKFTAEELITKREDVRTEMKQALYDRLISRGIVVEEVSITNFDFSESFNQAIEAKVTAEQLKLKADRDLERIVVEAQQKITQAQAEAESIRIQSEALKSNPNILTLRFIEKWSGILPQVYSTDSGINPFINIEGIVK